MTPTQRSLELLRDEGYLAAVVERWNPHAKIRQDLFGIIDILAVREDETLAVQTTSYSNVSARVKKISESDALAAIREAGWRIEVHGWHKQHNRWKVRRVNVS
jgi:carbonic anhydrase